MKKARLTLILVKLFGSFFLGTCPGLSQMVYNVSVYNDADTDGVQIYAVSTTVDQSTGCQAHGSYSTTATLIAPDGRQASATTGGMIARASMPINGSIGDFTSVGTVSFYCGCFMHWVGGGGPTLAITVALAQTGFKEPVVLWDGNGPYCHYQALSCAAGTNATCTLGNWTSSRPMPPCPLQILVEWLRVRIAGRQMCFVVDWDDVSGGPAPDCQ